MAWHGAESVLITTPHVDVAKAALLRAPRLILLQVVVIDEDHTDDESISAGSAFLARVLQYQETPQYLRKCGSIALTQQVNHT